MPNESRQERTRRELRENQQRCRDAARRWRHELNQGTYRGMPSLGYDDLTYVAALLDSAADELGSMPPQHQRAILAFVGRLLDDDVHKSRPVDPITSPEGDGY